MYHFLLFYAFTKDDSLPWHTQNIYITYNGDDQSLKYKPSDDTSAEESDRDSEQDGKEDSDGDAIRGAHRLCVFVVWIRII